MAICPLDNVLCWSLKAATIVICYYEIIFGSIAALLEILDIASLADPDFEIAGGFDADWRAHVWEGWLACNIVMLLFHLIMIAYSIMMIFAVKKFPTFYEFNLTKGFMALFIIYTLVEFGINCYRYSWYGPNTFRLGYLVFTFMYWIVRICINIFAIVVLYSRIYEMDYEIRYGEKKDSTGLISSRGATLSEPLLSGTATPMSVHQRA